MNDIAINAKIATLLLIKTNGYHKAGHWQPEIAAQFAVTDILNTYKDQSQYIQQLLDEEIEDAMKAAA